MAHPEPARPGGAQPEHREDRSRTGVASDTGRPAHPSPGRADPARSEPERDDPTQAPESGEKPDVMPPRGRTAR